MEWPVHKKELLGIGSKDSPVGLCTLWTEKEKVLRYINPKNYHVAGQCYSTQEGVNLIIRNCLANKKIRYLVLCGRDLTQSGDVLLALKEKGINGRNVVGFDTEIEEGIPDEAVERFRQNVDIIDKREILDYRLLDDFLTSLGKKEPWGESEIFERAPPKPPEFLPSEGSGFVVRGNKVGDTWLKILDTILRFGYIKPSQYGDDQQEIVSLISVVSDENPKDIDWKDYFHFSREHFENYLPQLTDSKVPEGISYTYGSKLRAFKDIDQVESIINQLKKAVYSRRAVAVTWDVPVDCNNNSSPCLDLIQALVQDKLYLTAYFRSNDMFGAWPENALALRAVQYEIAEKVGVEVGDLVIVSNSAHLYSSDWNKAKKIVDENIGLRRIPDPRGNILISLENNKIKIKHLSPSGKPIGEFYASNASEAQQLIRSNELISQTSHALSIGEELAKAEYALNHNLNYIQDKSLDEVNESKEVVYNNDDVVVKQEKSSPLKFERYQDKIKRPGKLIVIEGTDCSGKQTQAEMLVNKLKNQGKEVKMIGFPRYNTPSGNIVGICCLGKNPSDETSGLFNDNFNIKKIPYLGSWFGDADKIDPKIASLYYAADRRNARKEILELLDRGVNVVLDRYVESNMGHQGGKIKYSEERNKIINWIRDLEYGMLEMPKPDLVVFLYMPFEVAEKLKGDRKEAADSLESNKEHQKNAENCYLELANMFNWQKINCSIKNNPKTREEIQKDVWDVVKDILDITN